MAYEGLIKTKKYGFIGFGNMSQAIIKAFIDSGLIDKKQIFVTNRSEKKLKKAKNDFGLQIFSNNEELIDECDVIFLAMKPQDLPEAVESISSSFTKDHIVISLAAGMDLHNLKKLMPEAGRIVRIMPNTPAQIKTAVIGYSILNSDVSLAGFIESLFLTMGVAVQVEEGESFEALTVACGSGVGFVFEMMIYWQEWLEEHGFEKNLAKKLTVQTFLGASLLASNEDSLSVEELQRKVASKKGVTAAGLDSMRELEIERALRYSFEKAVLRDRELGRT